MVRQSFRCDLFGHKMPEQGWWGDGLYGRVVPGGTDGIGRSHFDVVLTCPRCGADWTTARFHGHQVEKYMERPQ